jgi:hypothetical protein
MGGCGAAPGEVALRLLEFRQRDLDSVALNEELALFFSSPLDPSSVTSDSVRVLDEDGREARGERRVRGNALSFLPALPCARDLSDGGLRPGHAYRIVLGGFPRPDGIRSSSGVLLSAGLVLTFRTAEIGSSPLFLDPYRGPFRLQPRGRRTQLEDGSLVLEYGEPLDPTSVPGCRFELTPGSRELEPLPTVARLIENRRDGAALRIELADPNHPGATTLPPGKYFLNMPGNELRTLGGRAVEAGWANLPLVVPPTRVTLDLAALRPRFDERPPGASGTATWDAASASLRLRFPAAAGNGAEGSVELVACPARADLQSTTLLVPEGRVVDLGGLVGPVVLRAQTSLEIRGRLTRHGAANEHDPLTGELLAAAVASAPHEPLGRWLERLLAPDQPWAHEPWTVLIAGGDLSIPSSGSIEVEGTLVLVAGGTIRADGPAHSGGNLWRSSAGGGNLATHGRNLTLPLELDEPRENPLRTSLRVGGYTAAFPWAPRACDWRLVLSGHEGRGVLDARFLQALPGTREERLLRDPSELVAGPARVLVWLEYAPAPGDPWDPPALERIELEALPAHEPASAPR